MFKREKLLVLFIATFFVIGFGSTRVGAQQSIAIQSLESDKYRSICQPQPYSEITSNTNAVAAIGSAVGSPAPATLAIVGTLSSSLHPEQHLLSNIGVNFEKDRVRFTVNGGSLSDQFSPLIILPQHYSDSDAAMATAIKAVQIQPNVYEIFLPAEFASPLLPHAAMIQVEPDTQRVSKLWYCSKAIGTSSRFIKSVNPYIVTTLSFSSYEQISNAWVPLHIQIARTSGVDVSLDLTISR